MDGQSIARDVARRSKLQDWIRKLHETRNSQELVAVTREYLANWYHGDLAEIAEAFRPTRIRDVTDIHFWCERLAEGFCGDAVHNSHNHFHREMHDFFRAASAHAGILPAPAPASAAPRARVPSR